MITLAQNSAFLHTPLCAHRSRSLSLVVCRFHALAQLPDLGLHVGKFALALLRETIKVRTAYPLDGGGGGRGRRQWEHRGGAHGDVRGRRRHGGVGRRVSGFEVR